MSLKVALAGAAVLLVGMVLFLALRPIPGAHTGVFADVLAAVFVIVFGFLFVTVSSRITGLIGSSSNPISGMAIATMMAVSVMFLIAGKSTMGYSALVIAIGGVVCIASANAGNTSQDLKAGFLVGATPRNQQKALLVGVLVSVVAIGFTLNGMNRGLETIRPVKPLSVNINALPDGVRQISDEDNKLLERSNLHVVDEKGATVQTVDPHQYKLLSALGSKEVPNGQYLFNPQTGNIEIQWQQGIGSDKAAAPQANLMATVVNGILTHRLPWNLVLIGVFIVIAVELLGIRSLSFAVGFYLSIATTLAIFVGGVVRWLVDESARRKGEAVEESEVSPGSLFASGLIAAGGVVGLLGICIKLAESAGYIKEGAIAFGQKLPTANWNWLGVIMFVALAAALYHYARKPIEK